MAAHSVWRPASAALLLLVVSPAAFARPAPVSAGERGLYGLPARLRNLTDLQFFSTDDNLNPFNRSERPSRLQATDVLLGWLAEERRNPSPSSPSIGGCPIDSDYIQQQLVSALSSHGDPAALDWLLESGKVDEDAISDDIRLALAGQGDWRQVDALMSILRDDPSQGRRYLAAESLGSLGANEAIALLERALNDPYSVIAVGGEHDGTTVWPIRRVAKESLLLIRNPQADAFWLAQRDAFPRRLAGARKALAKNKADLHRLVLAANGKLYGSRKLARSRTK